MDVPKKNSALIVAGLIISVIDLLVITGWLLRVPFFVNLVSGFAVLNLALLLIIGFIFFFVQERIIRVGFEQKVKQHEANFEKSEQRYHSLIEHASDAIYVLNKNRDFIHVNESMCKMTGYTRDELLTMNVAQLIDPEELKTDPLPAGLDKTTVRERTFVDNSGRRFPVEINVKRFTDDLILVIGRDISSRKAMEADLKEAEIKFRTIAEKSMVGIYIVQDGKLVYVNPRLAEVFGYMPEELIGTDPIETLIDENFREVSAENIRKRLSGEVESIHYDALGKKKDGSSNWVEFFGTGAVLNGKQSIIGSMIDINDEKKALEELRSSEHKYKLIFELNPTPLWMIGKEDMKVIANNEAAARLYGYDKDEIVNQSALIFRLEEDREMQLERYNRDIAKGDSSIHRHLTKDGKIIYVEITAHDITFEGKPVRLSMTTDVTEKLQIEADRKAAEQDLKTAYEQIQLQIESIREMAWKQSHLMRSPLANLKGLSALLNEDPGDKDTLAHIQEELDRMDNIIIEMAKDASEAHPL
jgi:PAS domain S-box-containing protein